MQEIVKLIPTSKGPNKWGVIMHFADGDTHDCPSTLTEIKPGIWRLRGEEDSLFEESGADGAGLMSHYARAKNVEHACDVLVNTINQHLKGIKSNFAEDHMAAHVLTTMENMRQLATVTGQVNGYMLGLCRALGAFIAIHVKDEEVDSFWDELRKPLEAEVRKVKARGVDSLHRIFTSLIEKLEKLNDEKDNATQH